jgi:hypothetical protein
MTERGSALLRHEFRWPALDAALLASAMRWAMLALVLVGAVWGLTGAFRRLAPRSGAGSTVEPGA